MEETNTPSGQVVDEIKGVGRASIPPASRFEKYHKTVLKYDPTIEITMTIQPNGIVRFKDSDQRMRVETDRGDSLDQRITHAFQVLITDLAAEKEKRDGESKPIDATQQVKDQK